MNCVSGPIKQVPVAHQRHKEQAAQHRRLSFLCSIAVMVVKASSQNVAEERNTHEPTRKMEVDDR